MTEKFQLIPDHLQSRVETCSKIIMAQHTRDLAGLIVYTHEKVASLILKNGESPEALETCVIGSLGLSVMSYGAIMTELYAEIESLKVQNSNLRNMIE